MDQTTQKLIEVGKLVFTFASVKRATLHEDGITPESDTDHTVMLSVCACALAEKLYPSLDIGKVAQYAIIHDLVEAYAGDTSTFNITDEERKKKEERENIAFKRIQKEFYEVYPWISTTIEVYEKQSSHEAQFVKVVDKLMTKLTHLINSGAFMKRNGIPKEETEKHFTQQTRVLDEKYNELFPEIISILKTVTQKIITETYASNS